IRQLAYVAQLDDPTTAIQSIAFVFDIHTWYGTLNSIDPDHLVQAAAFLTLADALDKLDALPWRAMREPLAAYLRGDAPAGSMWLYRQSADDDTDLLERFPAGR
ncbi:MAG: hypothetical protein MI924_39610, partial [Chloroflexales bacterium]|nr:hypothetical protein [Chloroflexales bacterium]